MEAIKTMTTMGYDAGDPNAVHPLSTSSECVFVDKDGIQVSSDDPNRLTKLSRYEFDERVKAGTATAGGGGQESGADSEAVPFDAAQRNPEMAAAETDSEPTPKSKAKK